MTTDFVTVPADMTAQGTIDYLRGLAPDAETIYYLYVVDGQDRLLGIVSLRWIQAVVANRMGTWLGRLFGLAALGMAGFGIYLGRYLRWSSWDVLLKPAALAHDVWLHVIHPVQHWQAWALALLFAALLTFAYGLLTTLGEARYPPAGL